MKCIRPLATVGIKLFKAKIAYVQRVRIHIYYNKNETHLLQFFVDSINVIICIKKVKKRQQAYHVREFKFKLNQYVKPCFSLSFAP